MRKQSANWYIAATHFITSAFVVPLLAMVILGLILVFLLPPLSQIIMNLLSFIIIPLVVWGGVVYSADFLKKKYIIKDKPRIVNLSTIYFVVLWMINLAFWFHILAVVYISINAVVFYFASKKYIEETSEISV